MTGRGFWALVAPTVIAILPTLAVASDRFCVSCSGPQASYLCEVTVPDGVVPSQAPQLYCAYRLAGDGQHASCASRRADASACEGGLPRKLAYQGPSLATTGTTEAPADAIEPAAPPDALAPSPAPPDALGETGPAAIGDAAIAPPEDAAATEAPAAGDAPKDLSRVTDDTGTVDEPSPVEAERSTGEKLAGAAKTAINCLASFFKECSE
jgi:hypothetical protein